MIVAVILVESIYQLTFVLCLFITCWDFIAEVKWWAWANKMPLEWAVMAVCLKKGVEASKAVGYSTLAWAALLAHQKAVGNDVVGKPIVSTIYLVFSVVVGTLLSF